MTDLLFHPPQLSEKPYTVSQINEGIAAIVESSAGMVWVEGEISNFKRAASGHCYLVLKDAESQIPAVMWKTTMLKHAFEPEQGMAVTVIAAIRVYRKGGYYQLDIQRMVLSGSGALYAAFEKLKKKLEKEGLFDRERKKPIPETITNLGIITAKTGAVLHDICRIVASRAPQTNIIISSVAVQGDPAVPQIVKAIEEMNRYGKVDCIILARGGGSIEDLWAFNTEPVARAIAASKIPIIAAIGHEVDVTLADYVADLRAPTPSAAAQIAVPDTTETNRYYDELTKRFSSAFRNHLSQTYREFQALYTRPAFRKPFALIEQYRQQTDTLHDRQLRIVGSFFQNKKTTLARAAAQLEALSPLSVLARGYSVVTDKAGETVRNSADLLEGALVDLRFYRGSAQAEIKKIIQKE